MSSHPSSGLVAQRPLGSLPSYLRLAPVAMGIATLVGFFSTILLKVAVAAVGGSISWAEAATGWVDWYIWAALTPLVVWLAQAVPVTEGAWIRAVAVHVLLGALLAAVELALFAACMTVYNDLFMGVDLPSYGARYLTLVGRWLPLQMLVYALIVAVSTAVAHGRHARGNGCVSGGRLTRLCSTRPCRPCCSSRWSRTRWPMASPTQ